MKTCCTAGTARRTSRWRSSITCSTDGVEPAYIREHILPRFFKHFWVVRMALDRRNYRQLVDTTVELANKVGGPEMIGNIVEGLSDESEPYRKMVIEATHLIVTNLGAADIDKKLEERLAKLSGGVCVIRVGAATEVELKEKKHRLEDAVSATRAAVEEGIVSGGGAALLHAAKVLNKNLGLSGDVATGVGVVRRALVEPLRWIAENAGHEGYVITAKVAEMKAGNGFNAATNKYGNLIKQGVIDPLKVTHSALENAASIASLLLTTETLVVEKKEEEPEAPAAGGHGHGHMH